MCFKAGRLYFIKANRIVDEIVDLNFLATENKECFYLKGTGLKKTNQLTRYKY